MKIQFHHPAIAFLLSLIAGIFLPSTSKAQLFWKLDDSTGTWTSTNWGAAAGGPFDTGWTAGSNAVFNANSTITYVTNTNVGNITLADGVTVNVTTAGTFSTGGNVRTINVGTGATFNMVSQNFSTVSGTGFIKDGLGIWNMGANANNYTGGFTLNAGTVIVSGNNSFGSGLLTINGGTIQSSLDKVFASSSIVVGGDFEIRGTGNWTMNMGVDLGGATRTITNNSTGLKTWNGVVIGAVGTGLTFAGSGTSEFTNAANTFTGDITITGSEVQFASDGSLGNAANDIVIDGGRFATSDGATFTLGAERTVFVGNGAATSIGVVGAGTLTINTGIANKIGETGSWAKQGTGTLELGGVSTYTGNTRINNGTVRITTGYNRLPTGTVVSLGQAGTGNLGTLDLNGFNQEIAGLNSTSGTNATTGNNTVTSTGPVVLTINNSLHASYGAGTNANSGVITGAISLVKAGAGTQTLGDTNTYSGATTVDEGALIINGDQSGATGNVTVSANGTLGGDGIIGGDTTISGHLRVGSNATDGTTGSLDFSGKDLSFASGSTWFIDIVGAAFDSVTGIDVFSIDPAANLSFSTFTPTAQSYTLASYASPADPNQFFANFADGHVFSGYQINYTNTAITLTAIPEPGTIGLLSLLLGGLFYQRIRSRRRKSVADAS